ncbi:lysostaphin resistance A-like protein [Agrilactobacillus fermenti]|uniref:CPBP family intramembrane glutamic endopeptidase n=1 Tax=Agrilactobacillus fermenti TaxID=2586909 RepID=UPI003A5BE8ED
MKQKLIHSLKPFVPLIMLLVILQLLGTLVMHTFVLKTIDQTIDYWHIPILLAVSLYDIGCIVSIWLVNHFLTKQATFWAFDRQQVSGFLKNLTGKRIFLIVLLIIYFSLPVMHHPNRLLESVVVGGCTAISEEFLFRGIIFGYLLRIVKRGDHKHIWLALTLSSLIFALSHLSNLQIQSLSSTLFQIIQAFGVGLLFATLYLKTGSLISSILLHFLIDFAGIAAANGAPEPPVYNTSILMGVSISLVFITIYLLFCRALLKDKHDLVLLNRPFAV